MNRSPPAFGFANARAWIAATSLTSAQYPENANATSCSSVCPGVHTPFLNKVIVSLREDPSWIVGPYTYSNVHGASQLEAGGRRGK